MNDTAWVVLVDACPACLEVWSHRATLRERENAAFLRLAHFCSTPLSAAYDLTGQGVLLTEPLQSAAGSAEIGAVSLLATSPSAGTRLLAARRVFCAEMLDWVYEYFAVVLHDADAAKLIALSAGAKTLALHACICHLGEEG